MSNNWNYTKKIDAMKPEWHIEHKTEGCYLYGVKEAKENKKYIKASISKDDIGNLLQGKNITLLFLNDEYEDVGMLDIELTDGETYFEVSEELNELIVGI